MKDAKLSSISLSIRLKMSFFLSDVKALYTWWHSSSVILKKTYFEVILSLFPPAYLTTHTFWLLIYTSCVLQCISLKVQLVLTMFRRSQNQVTHLLLVRRQGTIQLKVHTSKKNIVPHISVYCIMAMRVVQWSVTPLSRNPSSVPFFGSSRNQSLYDSMAHIDVVTT